MTDERQEIIKILRREMDKLPTDEQMKKLKSPFAFCFTQAKFDALMDIDRELKLGAFFDYSCEERIK